MELESLPPKDLARIIRGLVLAILGIGSVSGSGILRFDKFGASDAARLKEEIIESCHKYVEHEIKEVHQVREFREEVAHQRLIEKMPPERTKKRIKAIELCLERNCTKFQPPTFEWQ